MSLLSWLFGNKKQEVSPAKVTQKKKRGTYGFNEKRQSHLNDLGGFQKSNLRIKKVKIIVDKQDPDACSAIKKMRKVHNINEAPLIPLDEGKCQHCTCYYEPVLPKD